MTTDANVEKLELIRKYATSLGIEMFLDWSGDEDDEEFVGAFFSEIEKEN